MEIFSIVLCVLAFSPHALAGSRAWEAPLKHEVRLTQRDAIAVDAAGYSIRKFSDNDTETDTTDLRKRYLSVNPGGGNNPTYLWPDRTISYCFDTQQSKDAIFDYFLLAAGSWTAAGLAREVYKYKEVEKPGDSCVNSRQRDTILVISHNTEGTHATTPGRPPLDASEPRYKGPSMKLSAVDTVGQLSITANFAHEIGHAWGLYHEHQNRLFWKEPYGGHSPGGLSGNVFGDHFDCSALKDYFLIRGKIAEKYGAGTPEFQNEAALVCTSYNAAAAWGFSAADWLPITANFLSPEEVPIIGAGYEHVDWDSIMLYPSGAGGIGSARPPTNPSESPDIYDQRTPVLRRNDGAKFHTNAVPSAGDVSGIRRMYEGTNYDKNQGKGFIENLPNEKKNPKFSDFIKDFSFKKNKKCDNPNS